MSGYTHIIYFDKYLKNLEVTAKDQYYRTTECALEAHLKGLRKKPSISNIRVEVIQPKIETKELT